MCSTQKSPSSIRYLARVSLPSTEDTFSALFQTMDGTWLGENDWQEREEMNNFLARKEKKKIYEEEEEDDDAYLEDTYYQ